MTLTSIWRRNSSAASPSTGPATAMPALLTSPASVSPFSGAADLARRGQHGGLIGDVEQQRREIGAQFAFRRSASACLRTLPKTRKPRSSNSFAVAQPMPVDAPVMTTDFMIG